MANGERGVKEKKKDPREEAREILEKAIKEAKEIIEFMKDDAERKAYASVANKLISRIVMDLGKLEKELRERYIRAKYQVIDKIRSMVSEKVRMVIEGKHPTIRYDEALLRYILEATKKIGEEEIYIILNERDRETVSKRLSMIEKTIEEKLKRKVKIIILNEKGDFMGGIIARNKDGTKIFHCTVEGRVEEVMRRLLATLNKRFFKKYIMGWS